MDVSSSRRSPQEEGELEDGEICDDEPENKQQQQQQQQQRLERPTGSRKPPGACSGRAPQDYRAPHPFRPAPFLQNSGGPSAELSGPCGASFWERSHRALGKLRYRDRAAESRPERARGTGRGRNLYRRDSPNWKQKQSSRALVRKAPHSSSKPDNNGLDESFEDLLLKYKQIQLELECIRNQERNAIKPTEVPSQDRQDHRPTADPSQDTHTDRPDEREQIEEKKPFQAFNIRPLRQKLLTPAERDALKTKHTVGVELKEARQQEAEEEEEEKKEENQEEGKSQNKPTASNEVEEDEEESESDLNISLSKESIRKHGKDEDDELSELQLRLLALQSASRRWQQKEQQVMKESKEKLNRAKTTPEHCRVTTRSVSAGRGRAGPGAKGQEKGRLTGRPSTELGKAPPKGHFMKHAVSPVSKQARRKQQVRTWKLQQEQKQRSDEEEEKRKREEEIRKIRDLSNQEEQYNRFMKLVGGKLLSHTKSVAEPDYRKSMLKQGLDSALHLYQYDNYDEVAMDTDSETNSPAASPAREFVGVGFPASMLSLGSAPMRQDVSQSGLDPVGGVCVAPPPPPPPMPPPDELEPPPKPPFADEEEEEEMMLREELLKSLATKRAVRSEDASSNSGPPSPIRPLAPPTLRSTTSSAGFNSGSAHSRGSSKFNRGAAISRAPLVLPRHKAVVVRLNASDDSDSEIEASSSAQCVFGGLESMIKEARRTVEATRPRVVPTAEKENNPLRTPEALPENKKIEYRLLRAELTSRENRRIRKIDAVGVDSDDVAKKPELNTSEDKLIKHRAQLQKDQALLQQLRQQELRKKESLKMAEAKVMRLKEQLLAAEKVASAHRVQLRKHQEQLERVQHRVAVKQQQALRMERELAGCRRLEVVVDAHYADLMEQKKRLQQLESEYALKIQKLKEAQALRQASNPIMPCGVSQPSLHDLAQDKLTLASDDITDDPDPNEGAESQPTNTSARRRSFRESGSFTKPNLSHTETSATPPAKHSTVTTAPPAELLLLGLNVDELKLRQKAETLSELLQHELRALGGAVLHGPLNQRVVQVDSDPMAPQQVRTELKPVPFGLYHSPLLAFKSYRFSPYFRTKKKFSLSSVTFSNSIEPRKCFCRFDLTGTCNDDDCPWQHMRNCTLNGNQLFQDILSYSLPLIGCSEESSTNEISQATERYIKKLFGGNKDRMGSDQKAVLLVSKVNESLRHVPPYTTSKQRRKWRPEPQRPHPPTNPTPETEEENVTVPSAPEEDGRVSECWTVSDVCVTQDDKRYFDSETDDISNLEYSVLESPRDRQLWIKLAYRYLNQRDVSASECVDAALNTLSRALEDNREDEELWCHYLMLFSRRGNTDDVREMCDMAVEHAPHYSVWHTYLSIESSFEGKDAVCERMLQFLMEGTGGTVEELRSFQLLETLLYRTQLSVYMGRVHNARDLLKGLLISDGGCGAVRRLTLSHRALVWLCYIHLCEFQKLPSHLYDPAHSSPSRIVSLEPFLLPWSTGDDVCSPPELLITLFHDALSQCVDECVSPAERTLACLPLHMNLLHLHRILGRLQEAVALCARALSLVPHCCPLLEILSELHTAVEDTDEAVRVWLQAHKLRPQDAEVFYNLCKCLHVQGRHSEMIDLFKQFVASLSDNMLDDLNPVTTLQCLLGLQSNDFQRPAASLPHHLHPQIPYLHLTHSLCQVVCGSVVEAVEAFEAALGAVSDLDVVQKLWLDYLLFISSKSPAARELRVFGDLVQRCLNTVPIRISLPYNSTTYWSCFTFHNKVISFYLSFLPSSLHSSALERFRNLMPTNTELSLRVLQQEWTDGSLENLNLQARLISATIPTCLSFWKIVIAVQKEQKSWTEVQKLYQQALQKLPLCAALWKDRLLFEATAGGNSETLNKLVRRCQAVGVSLSETLSVTSHTLDPP